MSGAASVVVVGQESGEPVWTEPPTEARQGRQLQRYAADGARMVAGCLPIKWTAGSDGSPSSVQVLLISSRSGKGMVFPKGGWETDETVEAAAHRETVEEAGVRGCLQEPMLGKFEFCSKKNERMGSAHKARCLAHMFVMDVHEELDEWPESHERKRLWCSLQEASVRLRHEWMREALHFWIQRQGWDLVMEQITASAKDTTAPAPSNSSIMPLAQKA